MSEEETVEVIPLLEQEDENSYKEAIKWRIGNSSYEIHAQILSSYEIGDILPHCLYVKNRVESVVSNNNHIGPSLYRVLERTLSSVLQSVWTMVIAADAADNQDDVLVFAQRVRDLISVHASDEDREDLIKQIRNTKKTKTNACAYILLPNALS